MRLEFFMAKATKRTPIRWPEASTGRRFQWLKVINLQTDGSVKGQTKKQAYQVYLLCGDVTTKTTAQLLCPLPLQIVHGKGGKKAVHQPAAERVAQLLRTLTYVAGADYLEGLASNSDPTDTLRPMLVLDGDQEGTEQRAMHGLAQKWPAVPRIGIMHRASNCSAGNSKVRQLQVALRILTGGKASSKSLRGLWRKCYEDIRDQVATGWEPPEKEQIEREQGKPLVEAFPEGSCDDMA